MFRPDVYEVAKAAVSDGLVRVREGLASGKYIGEHFHFPEFGYFESGWPRFGVVPVFTGAPPKDLSGIFTNREGTSPEVRYKPNTIASWQRFWDLALGDERLNIYWGLATQDALFREWKVFGTLGNLVEKYYYAANTAHGQAKQRYAQS